MLWWSRFLDSLERRGGNYVILLVLMVFGAVLWKLGYTKADLIIMQAIGGLFYAMKVSLTK